MRRKANRSSARGKDRLAQLRAICLALPEASEKISHGEPTWFAGKGKVFAMFDDHHHGAPDLSVWLPAGVGGQEALIESDPKRYFRPPYVGSSGWVGVVLDTWPDWAVVAWLVEQASDSVISRCGRSKVRRLGATQAEPANPISSRSAPAAPHSTQRKPPMG